MAVHRIGDRAEAALQRLARKAGQKPAQFLEAGEEFTPPDQRPDTPAPDRRSDATDTGEAGR